ncbi:MAG: RDD family protein [Acidobacteriota bacterium]
MSKREKSQGASLPLFDLPLHGDGEGGQSVVPEAPSPPEAPGLEAPALEAPASVPEAPAPAASVSLEGASQPMLFTPEELTEAEAYEAPAPGDGNELPALQDRLLGGLADFTVVIAVVGLSIVAAQLLGVRITLASWPPFLVFGLLFSFPYAVIPLAFWGQTPGMAWVGHLARSEEGEPLSFGQTTQRWIGALLTVATVGLPLLLALGESGSSLADRLSASKTVHAP